MEQSNSFKNPQTPRSSDRLGLGATDRRLAFSRQASINLNDSSSATTPFLSRSVSSIDVPPGAYSDENDKLFGQGRVSAEKLTFLIVFESVFRILRSGNRYMKRLVLLISLNVAYSTAELCIGLFTGRVGLVSDAFHLTFGCGLLTFSLFAMAASRKKPDGTYTYGYKRLEVLSAFTNAGLDNMFGLVYSCLTTLFTFSRQLFLLFMSFSLAVEALHAFIQDESEHKHYLIVSAVTNLLVNLIGVWFFRNCARINLVYRNAEDMNNHSVCLHVLADSIRSAGLILASWFLSLGVENAEVLCFGLVAVVIFMLVMPLFRATGGILLQMAPPNVPTSALSKCWRQIAACEDVSEVSQARFWEVVPGHVVGSLTLQVKKGIDDRPVLQLVHGLYHDLGIQDLTVQADHV